MHCYCKNKSLSILAALFVANFVFGCGRVKEGFEEAMKKPEDLLKDAAEAASKAGEQLSSEGMAQAADKCAKVTGKLLDTKDECENTKKKDGSTPCDYTIAMRADTCYKDGAVVTEINGVTADATNCQGDGHMWSTSDTDATCTQ
jgi:hypothetical protein